MCGRYTLIAPERIAKAYPRFHPAGAEFSQTRLPRYNVAPTQPVLGVRNDGNDRIEAFRWGFLPSWSESPSPAPLINARAETLAVKPAFRNALRLRRCVLFADGFYEWRQKKPVYFTLADGVPFAFAALWEPGHGAPPSCVIVTCASNALVGQIHERMPVILTPDALALWLAPEELPAEVASSVLQPYDPAKMCAHDASTRLNNAGYDAPDVLVDDDPVQQSLGF
ncbi:MAG TPA: SOS response-associated peptidase [Candidatus Limnocylindria bacterium]|jgi:putative SOS response-associated peptidase YedK|nr:SOS response-associated peptidase [Candidatus Limnocylindria bacterium]